MSGFSSGAARRPRLQVLANGVPVSGACEAEVFSNSHYAADRFNVSLALGADPVWTAPAWSQQTDILLDVQMGFLPDGAPEGTAAWVSLVQGQVDTVTINPVTQMVRLDGRDLIASLIAAPTQETFANRTSSEIATILAGRHNLTAQAAPTATPVGYYYELEHDRITLNQFSRATTEWNLLVWLAQREGFDVWVQGTTLYFQPPQAATTPALVLWPVASSFGAANVIELRMERSLMLAGDIEVKVKSWNSRQQNAFTQTASSSGGTGQGTPQSYVYVRPNLTDDAALQFAQSRLAELTQHERIITALMPGELSLTPRSMVALQGTGTAFDQIYHVDSIERHLRFDGGFVQRVRAKNASTTDATPPAANAGMSAIGP